MKAIIVAAGSGNRLRPVTNEKPKCLLEIGSQTILERAIRALRENGIEHIVVVKGYHSDLINYPNITYYQNSNFMHNNILCSLFCAEDEMNDDFIFSYSDIIYSKEIVEKLVRSEADIALVTDVNWVEHYRERNQHPISQAELVRVKDGRVVKIGKGVISAEEAYGEFIGLAKFTKSGAETMRTAYHRVEKEHPTAPFHNAASLAKAYMTDMIQELIDNGSVVQSVDIEGGWMEIDTPQDLAEVTRWFVSNT
ncbi:MAG: phosphocholine cytidylyltransferase family protein [Dehalococcoidales bacterium]|nr:phosphocholine cytidylyltransferase family protein [Dehalococcoidales bacterium]